MKASLWKRLNTAQLIFIGLLILGVIVAVWMEKASSQATLRSDKLTSATERIRYELLATDYTLRGHLLETKPELEKKFTDESRQNFTNTINYLRQNYGHNKTLNAILERARHYTETTTTEFQTRTVDLQKTNPTAAIEHYRTNTLALRQQRDDIATELNKFTGDYWLAEYHHAEKIVLIGSATILTLIIATFYAGYRQTKAISQPLTQLVNTLDHMRRGDFTQRLNLQRKDEFGFLSDSLNRLADDLSILVGQVQRSGIQVNMTATEIAATAKEQQSTSTEIAATTAEIGATSKQISATSKELDKTMHEVGQVAADTTQLANRGQTGITRMETTMRQIMEASSAVTAKLAVLNEKMANIATVVTTITKVADQTNLLSLNAAIEAEKAGEYGLGFAVVALEIRRLADQTAVATYDIEKMVKEMQSAVAAGVMGMDKFSEDVRRGAEENRLVNAQLAQIIHQVQTLTPRFATVTEGMHAQATGAQQISETLTQLSEAAHQSADTLRQSNLAIDQLNEAARGLQTSVARFKLEGK